MSDTKTKEGEILILPETPIFIDGIKVEPGKRYELIMSDPKDANGIYVVTRGPQDPYAQYKKKPSNPRKIKS
jgi:hypothetical protein